MDFKFLDYYKLTVPDQDFIKSFDDSLLDTGYRRGLAVKLEATHAALFNKNRRFYLPGIMERDASTFTTRRAKPAKILKHHDAHSDPVGIITDQNFVWTVPEELRSNKDVQIMMDPSFPASKQIAAAKRFMQDGYPFQEGWRGLGHISLEAIILDEKAIRQVKDGRFDAVSTSFLPGKDGVYCTECLQNLMEDGPCEHQPGKIYKDEDGNKAPCAWIPLNHNYEECSLVVFDADPLTSLEVVGDVQDSKKIFTFDTKTLNEDSFDNGLEFSFRDFKEDAPAMNEQEQKIYDILKEFRPDMKDEDRIKLTKDVSLLVKDGKFHPDQEEVGLSDEETIKNIVEDIETEDQTIDADAIYDEMAKELQEDEKLSTEKRKSLSKSTFCGPDRSFPVPDCSHVTAARRLIGRYKGPGDKTAILACVNRKAKALGCDARDSTNAELSGDITSAKMIVPTSEMLTTLDNAEAKSLFNMVEAELITRNLTLTRPCAKCAEADERAKVAVSEKETIEDQFVELGNHLKYLRQELKDQYGDYSSLMDQLLEVQTALVGEKIERLSLLGRLVGKYDSIDLAKEQLRNTNLNEQEVLLTDSFDVEKAYAKLNDGIDHTPTGEQVKDPDISDKKNGLTFFNDLNLNPSQEALVKNIKTYNDNGQFEKANSLYVKMVSMKVLDSKQLPFDKIISAEALNDIPAE